jgi:hypothetical protein
MLYLHGKAEPMCMSMSSQSSTMSLYKMHLSDIVPKPGSSEIVPPTRSLLEEMGKRDMKGLFSKHPAFPEEKGKVEKTTIRY